MNLLEFLRNKTESEYKDEMRQSLMGQSSIVGGVAGAGLGTLATLPLIRERKAISEQMVGLQKQKVNLARKMDALNEVVPGTGRGLVDIMYGVKDTDETIDIFRKLPEGIRENYLLEDPINGSKAWGPKMRELGKPWIKLNEEIRPQIKYLGDKDYALGMKGLSRKVGGGLIGAALGAAIINHLDKNKEGPLFGR